ncbi:MAG: MIP/aquaporin family protein [Pseudomonadota bacterium]
MRRVFAEFLGTMILLTTVIGSGIMGETLSPQNPAIALLGNTIPTGAILYVLITTLGPVSGAHFNPAVTFSFWLRKEINGRTVLAYLPAQVIGGCLGVILANMMFDLDPILISEKTRASTGQTLSEIVATFGLIFTIFMGIKHAPKQVAALVGLYITAAYWFTASTSFANPAVTLARTLSDTFAGITPSSIFAFVAAQMIGSILAVLSLTLFTEAKTLPKE